MRSLRPLLTISACLLTFAGNVYQGQAIAKNQPNAYPAQVVKAFTDACVAGGGTQVNPELMKQVCSCSIDEIQNQYTLDEFVTVANAMQKGDPMSNKISQIVQTCVEQAVK